MGAPARTDQGETPQAKTLAAAAGQAAASRSRAAADLAVLLAYVGTIRTMGPFSLSSSQIQHTHFVVLPKVRRSHCKLLDAFWYSHAEVRVKTVAYLPRHSGMYLTLASSLHLTFSDPSGWEPSLRRCRIVIAGRLLQTHLCRAGGSSAETGRGGEVAGRQRRSAERRLWGRPFGAAAQAAAGARRCLIRGRDAGIGIPLALAICASLLAAAVQCPLTSERHSAWLT